MFDFDFISGSIGAAISLLAVAGYLSRKQQPEASSRAVSFIEVKEQQHAPSIPDMEIDRSRPGVAQLEKRLGIHLLPHEIIAFMTFEQRSGQQLFSREPVPAGLGYLNALRNSGEVDHWITSEHMK